MTMILVPNRQLLGGKDSTSGKNVEIEDEYWLQRHVEAWTGKHISRWIEGLGDCMNPFLGTIRDNIRSGRHLGMIDNDSLLKIGISGLGARKTIIQAIQVLDYFCHEAPHENMQSLSMKVMVGCNTVSQEMLNAIRQREKIRLSESNTTRRAEIVSILNSVSSAISNLAEHVKRLVFWLDRSPFDGVEQYVEWRNQISFLIWSLVRNVNVQPKALFSVSSDIVKKSNELKELCDFIVRGNDDPAVLYTSNVEQAVLRRREPSYEWGINVQSSYRGVHVISEIKEGSPADVCGRIDAGDEILLINGKTVIGWDLIRVAQRLGSMIDVELRLVVNKRPRDSVPILMKNAVKISAKPLAKMAPGSQTTYTTDVEKAFMQEICSTIPLSRRRSSTHALHLRSEYKKTGTPTRKRRSSISCGRENRSLDSDTDETPQHVQWDLHELLGLPSENDSDTRVVRRARTMRHQPDGYVRSYIDNKLVQDIDDDVIADQLPFNVKCPTEFAKITIVEPEELTAENIVEPNTTDAEWSAPINDVAVQRFRAPAGDSNLSGLSLDSPRRMLSSVEEAFPAFGVLPSPSTSSIHSVSSPAPHKLMATSLSEWTSASGDEIPLTPMTPSTFGSGEKIFEGWARRRKTGTELSESTNKWPKCWMCLKGPYLSIYPNQYAKRADITINVSKCTVSDAIDIKTSKKFVFRLSRPSVDYHFSCYNPQDMKSWIHKIGMAGELYGNPGRSMSKSMSYFKDQGSGDELNTTHYNTMTGLPSLMSQSTYECTSATSPGPGSNNSLPRVGLLSTLVKPLPPVGSQTSVKSKK